MTFNHIHRLHWQRFAMALFIPIIMGVLPASSSPRTQEATGPAFPIKQLDEHCQGSDIYTINNTLLFFVTCADENGIIQPIKTLWRSDGTTAGTEPIKTFTTEIIFLVNQGNSMLFFWTLAAGEYQLWRSDGTVDGTIPLKTFSEIHKSIAIGDVLYVVAINQENSSRTAELWKSDGTIAGTLLVRQLLDEARSQSHMTPQIPSPVQLPPVAEAMEQLNNSVLILMRGYTEYTLWRSDGTLESTTLVAHISTPLLPLKPFNNRWLLIETLTGRLWQTDGSRTGTMPLDVVIKSQGISIPRVGSQFFVNQISPEGPQLVGSNATALCTFQLAQFPPTSSLNSLSLGEHFLLFTVYDPAAPTLEIWRSDGSQSGTSQITQLSLPQLEPGIRVDISLMAIEGDLHLIMIWAYTPNDASVSTLSLWRSDGTAASTTRIQEGIPLEYPAIQATLTEDALYFWGEVSSVNPALWKLPRSAIIPNPETNPTPNPESGTHQLMLPFVVDQC